MAHIDWIKERETFLATREAERETARQRLALQILCGENLDTMIALGPADRLNYCRRLKRLIERERIKGGKGHWSYDLNRHIGLKQALDTLQKSIPVTIRAD
ncbi:cytoplasmic protein [Phyllobacterium sp. TAF24]|uniref:cytoplasmic protein n=1 Tax=Phyllobacterium sp. TAF24 TaxID=3233068 RepID=UPI003F994A97